MVRLNMTVPDIYKTKFERLSKRSGLSMSELLRRWIDDEMALPHLDLSVKSDGVPLPEGKSVVSGAPGKVGSSPSTTNEDGALDYEEGTPPDPKQAESTEPDASTP